MDYTISDIEETENLASQNYTAREIAMVLDKKPSLFIALCLDIDHPLGVAYRKGLLEVERIKKQNLLDKVFQGSETAIQIHDKKAKEQAFLDIKNDMFSGFDE